MSKTVLTIDDSASIRQMVSMTLKEAGFKIIEAVDGKDGYEKATSSRIDIVITDVNMPNMNGFDFIKKYRQHPSSRGIPVIFLTTESDVSMKQKGKSAGATGWMVKPFKRDQLLAVVRKVAR